jgi:type I restriction enzyme S subunit
MSDWKTANLGNLAEVQTGPFGSQLKNEQYITGGTPVVTVEHITNFLIEDFTYPSVTDEDKNRLKKYTLKAGDIVFSRVGSVDLSALVKNHQDGWLFSSRMLRVRVKEKLNTKFLSYYLRQSSVRQFIINTSVGSTMPSINTELLKNLPVVYCSLEKQKKIASVLSSLDDKIELNNRINSELENLAKTIYDYWFVQFDFPDENGKPYKSSGGKMVYNQEIKREIPVSWEVKLLGDIGKNIKNGIKQTDIDPEIPYIGLEHIPRKKIALDTWSTAFDLASDKLSFARRDILFGKLRPYFHKVGVAFISGVCSTDILVLNSKKESYFGFFLMVVSSDNFINYVNLATEGTRMPRTKWEFMKQYLLPIPKEDITQKFNDILKPLISQMENNTYQNQQLTQLRDWLLLMLMNGQITIK